MAYLSHISSDGIVTQQLIFLVCLQTNRIGYGFILLCYKLRDLTTATKEPTRTAHFLETMQRGKFEQVVLGASLALTIFLMIALLANEVSCFFCLSGLIC